jgi:glycosyltransferase involved in cell wall biosynthesis
MSVSSLSIVIPCLNEEKTLPVVIRKVQETLANISIPSEIVVADNGSTDRSRQIAEEMGARCVEVPLKGYGAALHLGITAAKGTHVIFADADASYDFGEIPVILRPLMDGADLVVGNRFKGGIEKGAMPLLHRYLGTPVLSFLGRQAFHVKMGDFNCGLRGLKKEKYDSLGIRAMGMDYATEQIARASMNNWDIREVPVHLYKDRRDRAPHLRTWQDGWRQLRLILLLGPKLMLLYPAIFFGVIGTVLGAILVFKQLPLANLKLDIHTLYYCSVSILISWLLWQCYAVALFYGSRIGFYPPGSKSSKVLTRIGSDNFFAIGISTILIGVVLSFVAVWKWRDTGFHTLDPYAMFRIIIPAGSFILFGMQSLVFSFLISLLQQPVSDTQTLVK